MIAGIPLFWLIVIGAFFLLAAAMVFVLIMIWRRIRYMPMLLEYIIYQSIGVELDIPGREPLVDKPEFMTIEQFMDSKKFKPGKSGQ